MNETREKKGEVLKISVKQMDLGVIFLAVKEWEKRKNELGGEAEKRNALFFYYKSFIFKMLGNKTRIFF